MNIEYSVVDKRSCLRPPEELNRIEIQRLVHEMRETLLSRLDLPLIPGEKFENHDRSQIPGPLVCTQFDHPDIKEGHFLDSLGKVSQEEFLHFIREGLMIETNYPFGRDTATCYMPGLAGSFGAGMALYDRPTEAPFLQVRRLHVGDGEKMPVGYAELSAFCRFFRARHIIF